MGYPHPTGGFPDDLTDQGPSEESQQAYSDYLPSPVKRRRGRAPRSRGGRARGERKMPTTLKVRTNAQEEISMFVDCRTDYFRTVFERIEVYSQPPSNMKAVYFGRSAAEGKLLLHGNDPVYSEINFIEPKYVPVNPSSPLEKSTGIDVPNAVAAADDLPPGFINRPAPVADKAVKLEATQASASASSSASASASGGAYAVAKCQGVPLSPVMRVPAPKRTVRAGRGE